MKLMNFYYVKACDWEALYHLGKLVEEGHQIDWEYWAKNNVIHISSIIDASDEIEQYISDNGGFPERYSELGLDKPVVVDTLAGLPEYRKNTALFS